MGSKKGARKVKKKYHAAFIAVYVLIIVIGVIWHAGGASAQDTIKLTVNSHTTSTATMNNMKPGDEMNSKYTIINDGNEDFSYFVDFKFISGDEVLFNILQMTLEKDGKTIYSGLMSEAAGRVTIGTLTGGGQSDIQMDVIFPYAAGNEYQGKTTTVAFEFSASGEPKPTTEPTSTPTPTITPTPTPVGPSPTPDPTQIPTEAPTETVTPTTSPSSTATVTPSPSASQVSTISPAPTPSPSTSPADEISVTEEQIPLSGNDSDPTASPNAGSQTTNTTQEPGDEITIPDDDLPLGAPDEGNPLPNTSEPWYNLIVGSLAIAIFTVFIMYRLRSKK